MKASEWRRLGELEANSLHYWFRNRFDLPLTDPRYLNATDQQIRLEFEAGIAFRIMELKALDPSFNEELEYENQTFSMRAREEDGFLDDWCRQKEKEFAKNPEFRDDDGKFTTEKIEMYNPDFVNTKSVTLKDIEKAEKEIDGIEKG